MDLGVPRRLFCFGSLVVLEGFTFALHVAIEHTKDTLKIISIQGKLALHKKTHSVQLIFEGAYFMPISTPSLPL